MSSLLKKQMFEDRVRVVPGGKLIHWSPTKDYPRIEAHIDSLPLSVLRKAAEPARKDEAMRSASNIVVRAIEATDLNFLWVISRRVKDLVNDIVDNVDCGMFNNNPAVLAFHNSSALPVATSSAPYRSGIDLMAVVKFPKPGVNAAADEMAAAVRAGLIKGASIGFRPIRYSFSKDPSRPMGIDFHEVELMEFSLTPQPCCPGCLMVGPVSAKSADEYATAARKSEARNMVSLAKSGISRSSSREQRLAEARQLRRLVDAM
jgi:hypothetical protein